MRKEDKIRQLIAREAAQIMYHEGMGEYRDAKRKAARQFGSEKALSLGSHLPSNAEIHLELQRLIALFEEKVLPERLLHLRLMALRQMEMLSAFRPYLVGSVLNGAVTAQSDIDLHLFAGSCEEVEDFLQEKGISFHQEVISIRHGGEFFDYPHIYLEDQGEVIDCTVYPREEIHRIPKSSITGRPMERADVKKLKKMVAATLVTDNEQVPPRESDTGSVNRVEET